MNPVSDNTAASTMPHGDLCGHAAYYSECRHCRAAQREMVHKAALDTLREAVKGCGTSLSSRIDCGDKGVVTERHIYCSKCTTVIQTAISRLLGSGQEVSRG